MDMKVIQGKRFTGSRAWEAIDVAILNGISIRVHWTDQPYHWHVNDGEEVFVVLDGQVKMLYREMDIEKSVLLMEGDIFYAELGCEHLAEPIGEARILVIEKHGSI
jgi:mannose-6-phosphate isomerase-like protein (cupin superfamily)